MSTVIPIRGATIAPRAAQSSMETLIITPKMVNEWRLPPFQRPLRINNKVQALVEVIKCNKVIEGVLTLGKLRDATLYIVDGQHRAEAFKLSGEEEAIADIRLVTFDSMTEMAEEFVRLNSSLVKMRPDDILRGLESSVPALRAIRKSCEFVGYDQIRRQSTSSPMVSMSALMRCWHASLYETPAGSNSGQSAAVMAQALDEVSVGNLTSFLALAHAAWGRDPEYYRLWGNLNLALCMWIWNKLVIDRERQGNKRYIVLNAVDFKKCLMSISANSDYVNWLPGRNLCDRDRSPAYNRLKAIFIQRLQTERHGKKVLLPAPAWASR